MAITHSVRSGIPLGRTLDGLVRLWETPEKRLVGATSYDARAAAHDLGLSLPSLPSAASPADIGAWKRGVMESAQPVVSRLFGILAASPDVVGAVRAAELDVATLPIIAQAGLATFPAVNTLLDKLHCAVATALAEVPSPLAQCKRGMVAGAIFFSPLAMLGPLVRPELTTADSLLMSAVVFLLNAVGFGCLGGYVDSTHLARTALRYRDMPSPAIPLLNAIAKQPSFTRWWRIGFLYAHWKTVREWKHLSAQVRTAQSSLTADAQVA